MARLALVLGFCLTTAGCAGAFDGYVAQPPIAHEDWVACGGGELKGPEHVWVPLWAWPIAQATLTGVQFHKSTKVKACLEQRGYTFERRPDLRSN
jgi:hypothetical protein